MTPIHRRSIRLPNHDYRSTNTYFLTICAELRRRVFGGVVDGRVRLYHLGEVVDQCWREIPSHFPHAALDVHVVMPDHIHGLLSIARDEQPPSDEQAVPCAGVGSLPVIVRHFKAAVTRTARQRGLVFGVLWQRNYYEHVVRNDSDLARIRTYIANNPSAWEDERTRHDRSHVP